jgi:hypothetical protein
MGSLRSAWTKLMASYLKDKIQKGPSGREHLPTRLKALSSIPSSVKEHKQTESPPKEAEYGIPKSK